MQASKSADCAHALSERGKTAHAATQYQEGVETSGSPSLTLHLSRVYRIRPPLRAVGALWQRAANDFLDFAEGQLDFSKLDALKVVA
jgi:hypothetical protein